MANGSAEERRKPTIKDDEMNINKKENGVSTQIYYFSGTGNSLHVARELQKRLGGAELVPIVGALKTERIASAAETVGLVFPIHNLTSPTIVRTFVERADLRSAKYLFAVATRECSDIVFLEIDRLLALKGKALKAWFSVEMPCTYTPLFPLPSAKAEAEMERKLEEDLEKIAAVVAAGEESRQRDDPIVFFFGHILYPAIKAYMFAFRFPGMARSFYADSKCTGCGVCERICPAGRIRMADGRPEWRRDVDCLYCFACLHLCPAQAVQLRGRNTKNRGRYRYPGTKPADIARQKEPPKQ
jgi:ferredoxin